MNHPQRSAYLYRKKEANNHRMSITLFLIEDKSVVRKTLESKIEIEDDIEIIGCADDSNRVLLQLDELEPDVILFDVSGVPISHIHTVHRMRAACPSARVLAVVEETIDIYVGHLKWCGVHGYISKKSTSDELADAIETIHNKDCCGDSFVDGKKAGTKLPLRDTDQQVTREPSPAIA